MLSAWHWLRIRMKRLTWRVIALGILFLAPSYMPGLGKEKGGEIREACVVGFIAAVSAWASQQGRRYPDRGRPVEPFDKTTARRKPAKKKTAKRR